MTIHRSLTGTYQRYHIVQQMSMANHHTHKSHMIYVNYMHMKVVCNCCVNQRPQGNETDAQ